MPTFSTGETFDLPLDPNTLAELDDNMRVEIAFHGLARVED